MDFDDALTKVNKALDDFYLGKLKDRNLLIKEWITFLDVLKEACVDADEEDKTHYRLLLNRLANKLATGILALTKDAGFSEDDIHDLVDNPSNFDEKAWNDLKGLQRKIDQRMKIILPLLAPGEQKGKKPPPSKKKRGVGERRIKRRSGWMPS